MWPDVEIKSRPNISQICQNVARWVLPKTWSIQNTPKSNQIFGLLCVKNYRQELSKLAQSGHTELIVHFGIIVQHLFLLIKSIPFNLGGCPLNSVTKLDEFWKYSATILLAKAAQNIGDFEAVKKVSLNIKLLWHLFGQLLVTFGLHFYFNNWSHCLWIPLATCLRRATNSIRSGFTFNLWIRLLKSKGTIISNHF